MSYVSLINNQRASITYSSVEYVLTQPRRDPLKLEGDRLWDEDQTLEPSGLF